MLADSSAPRGSIYHHFPEGKAQPGVQAVTRAGEFIGLAAAEHTQASDVVESVRRFIEWWTEYLESGNFEAGCPIVAVAAEFHRESPALVTASTSTGSRVSC